MQKISLFFHFLYRWKWIFIGAAAQSSVYLIPSLYHWDMLLALGMYGLWICFFMSLSRAAPAFAPLIKSMALLWVIGWSLMIATQLGIRVVYGIPLRSTAVLAALGNTTFNEVREFILQNLPFAVAFLSGVILLTWFNLRMHFRVIDAGAKAGQRASYLTNVAVLAFCAVLLVIPHGIKKLRLGNPIFFAMFMHERITGWNLQFEDFTNGKNAARAKMGDWDIHYDGPKISTLVLVLGESVNRSNWSLYGYARNTTPQLDKMKGELLVFSDVISSAASTVPSLINMLTPAELNGAAWNSGPSVLMMAKAVGYKIFWLSNHDDIIIKKLFGDEADELVWLNRGGRSSKSLDEELLPGYQKVLEDPVARKLIVIHQYGAHPAYRYRYPERFDQFSDAEDAVSQQMSERWPWVASARNEYDNAMLYQDHLIHEFISLLRQQDKGEARLLYVADHSQEVGHSSNHTGHAPDMESGYTIPLLLWEREGIAHYPRDYASRPYQTDKLDWTLLNLLHIQTSKNNGQADLLGKTFIASERRILDSAYIPNSPAPTSRE